MSLMARVNAEVRKTVLVVGAGYTGLLAAAYFRARGCKVVVVEKQSDLGGLWRDRANPWSCTECSAAFYLYPFQWPTFANMLQTASRRMILESMKKFAERQGIIPSIRFETELVEFEDESCVSSCGRVKIRGRRKVALCDNVAWPHDGDTVDAVFEGVFDHVVSCTGTLSRSRADEVPLCLRNHPMLFTATAELYPLNFERMKTKTVTSILILGGGSSAIEALDKVCDPSTGLTHVSEVHLVMRHRKIIFYRRFYNTCMLVFINPCLPWNLKAWLCRRLYGVCGLTHAAPRSGLEARRWYTSTTSRWLFEDPRIHVHIAEVDDVSTDDYGVSSIHLTNGETFSANAVIAALGTQHDSLHQLKGGILLSPRVAYLGDIVNGSGVWAVRPLLHRIWGIWSGESSNNANNNACYIEKFDSMHPTDLEVLPRTVDWFVRRSVTVIWECSINIEGVRLVACLCTNGVIGVMLMIVELSWNILLIMKRRTRPYFSGDYRHK